MPEQSWDAVVVGAGLGGLTAAAYLSVSGMRTLVLEHNMVAGGCSQVFRRRGVWEFDVGVHYVGQCHPDGVVGIALRGLGLADRIEWLELDPDGYATLVYPGLTFRIPRGWDNYLSRLIETFPDERRGLRRCIGLLRRMAAKIATHGVPQGRRELMLAPVRMPATVFGSAITLGRLFDMCRLSPAARAVIAGECGDYACPPSRTAASFHAGFLNHYLEAGGFYPKGGGQVLAAHLIDVIQSHGGAVHTKADVDRIEVENGRVTGILLRGGQRLGAPVVISNADIKRTYLELVGREHPPARAVAKLERFRMALPLFSVYLGLDIDLSDRLSNTIYWYYPSYDIESVYRAAYSGRVPDVMPIFMTSASVKDPGNPHAAPPGHSTLEVMALVPADSGFWCLDPPSAVGAWNTREPAYLAAKEALMESVIDSAATLISDLRQHIVFREASTPMTQERFTLSSGGACYGLELAIDQTGRRRPAPTTDIPGLFLAGASTFYNHAIAGAITGGLGTAAAVLGRDLEREVRSGRVLADPAKLTAGGPGWDPWLHSKPRAARSRPRESRATSGV
jgi:all-trans-retinol 13,14-reductase